MSQVMRRQVPPRKPDLKPEWVAEQERIQREAQALLDSVKPEPPAPPKPAKPKPAPPDRLTEIATRLDTLAEILARLKANPTAYNRKY